MKRNICYIAFICILISLTSFSQTIISLQKQLSGNPGNVFISPDFSSDKIDTVAGTTLYFTLTAKDSLGNIIQDWNTSGSTITVMIKNSSANTDSSNRSWNSDADGYSYAMLSISNASIPQPVKITDSSWEISRTSFVQGQTQLCLIDTKAEKDVYLQISPLRDVIKQSSANMNFKPAEISNFLVEITSQTNNPDQVYQMRKHEVVVTPRDRYLNYSSDAIKTMFTARFPGEYDNSSIPDPFGGEQNIKGQTPFLFISTTSRKKPNDLLQQVVVFSSLNMSIRGRSDDYEILTHEPGPFSLALPIDLMQIEGHKSTDTSIFLWDPTFSEKDIYNNIRISRFDSTRISDSIYYTVVFADMNDITSQIKFLSDQRGKRRQLTLTWSQLVALIQTLSGNPTIGTMNLFWWVEATDSVYTTLSTPHSGFRVRIYRGYPDNYIAERLLSFSLSQNYPNPFGSRIGNGTSSTSISFSLDRSSQIILKVYDALGKELSMPVNQFYEAGEHIVTFDAAHLPAGNYFYRLFANGNVLTRQMTVVK